MKLGIIGGGQLGRMLFESAASLGVETVIVDESENSSASFVSEVHVCSYKNIPMIQEVLKEVDVVTYEFENIPIDLLSALQETKKIYPPISALEISRHREKEKKFAQENGIPVPSFVVAHNLSELESKKRVLPFPVIVKTCTEGYDGKGQWRFNSLEDFESRAKEIIDTQLIAEEKIDFDLEFSIIATRDTRGLSVVYPACFNVHDKGTLAYTLAPSSKIDDVMYQKAKNATIAMMEALSYVGTIAIEYFLKGDCIYFNEFAPRVHNSGHWSIEGAVTSQFENHIRACMGFDLGPSTTSGYSLMVNLLGTTGDREGITNRPHTFYHWYDKDGLGNRRKVGHVTTVFETEEQREQEVRALTSLCGFSF